MKLPFPLLHDPDLAVTKKYTDIHPKAGPGGRDVTRPATVIVGKDGKIKWVSQYPDIRLRPDPEDLLRVLKSD